MKVSQETIDSTFSKLSYDTDSHETFLSLLLRLERSPQQEEKSIHFLVKAPTLTLDCGFYSRPTSNFKFQVLWESKMEPQRYPSPPRHPCRPAFQWQCLWSNMPQPWIASVFLPSPFPVPMHRLQLDHSQQKASQSFQEKTSPRRSTHVHVGIYFLA